MFLRWDIFKWFRDLVNRVILYFFVQFVKLEFPFQTPLCVRDLHGNRLICARRIYNHYSTIKLLIILDYIIYFFKIAVFVVFIPFYSIQKSSECHSFSVHAKNYSQSENYSGWGLLVWPWSYLLISQTLFFLRFKKKKNRRRVSKITYIFLSPELKSLAENLNTHSSQAVSPSLKSVHISRKHAEMKPCNKRLFTIYSTFAFLPFLASRIWPDVTPSKPENFPLSKRQ